MIVLVDTNILLDVIQRRQPHDVAATRVWDLVERKAVDGYVSAISFNNVFYVARKKAGVGPAMDAVRAVRSVFKVVPLDDELLEQAITATTEDLEDAIQAAAARRVGADHLVTRNGKDFAPFEVSAVTAEEFLALV